MGTDAMIETLGETELLLSQRLNRALVASDRVTYYLTLLQAARHHTVQPDAPVTNLSGEREARGVDDDWLDGVVENSRVTAAGDLYVPAAQQILQNLFAELELMLQPLRSAGAVAPELNVALATYARRLASLQAGAPSGAGDRLPPNAVDVLTRGGDAAGDSVHQLTLDLHKELRRLQSLVADDVIDGAHTYGLGRGDVQLVTAFMKGVNETSPLALDHPGLATTATRVGARLSIQTDIDATDAHVVILHVEGMNATVIYTDVHHSRVVFLREMLDPFPLEWHEGAPPATASSMAVGSFAAHDAGELARFLTFVGSRLVFLIDWKRARRDLARLVKKSDATAVLRWAAEQGVGHRAFLKVDGWRLIAGAFAAAVPEPHASLPAVLGRDGARTFLCEVMRITSQGLRAGRSAALIQDEIEVELLRHVQPDGCGLIGAAAEHAVYIFALAERLRHVFVRVNGSLPGDVTRTAELAKTWEARADEIVHRWRRIAGRNGDTRAFCRLLTTADRAADALEDATYLLTLVPPERARDDLAALGTLPDLVSHSAKEYVRCLDFARQEGLNRVPADVEALLVAVDRIATFEHQCDEAERSAEIRLIHSAATFRDLHVLSRLVHAFEKASDALAWSAALVKDHVLNGHDEGGYA